MSVHDNEINVTGTNTPLLHFLMETWKPFKMDFNSILNKVLRNQAIYRADMPLIGMSGVPQIRVDVIGRAMQLVGNHTYLSAIRE